MLDEEGVIPWFLTKIWFVTNWRVYVGGRIRSRRDRVFPQMLGILKNTIVVSKKYLPFSRK